MLSPQAPPKRYVLFAHFENHFLSVERAYERRFSESSVILQHFESLVESVAFRVSNRSGIVLELLATDFYHKLQDKANKNEINS